MSEMISRDSLLQVLRFLSKNTRLSSPKSLASACNISTDNMVKILEVLKDTSYVVINTFPKGAFKNYKFTYYGKGYVYMDGFVVISEGQLIEGSNRRSASPLSKHDNEYHRNRAAEKGLPVMTSGKFLDALADKVYAVINHDYLVEKNLLEQKAALEAKYRVFEGYPLALAQYQKTETEQADLERRAAVLQQQDAELKKEYEHQLYLAKHGQRTKNERYSVQVGTEQVYMGSYRAKYWFDDEGTLEHRYETMPKYESRVRTVVDMPIEPEYHAKEIAELQYDARQLGYQLSYIKSHLCTIEKDLQHEAQEALDYAQYQKERQELDKKYGGRFK